MPAFSYTAPMFTSEDEERENADLTPEEKEAILDDMYGRNLDDEEVIDDENNNQEEEEDDDEDNNNNNQENGDNGENNNNGGGGGDGGGENNNNHENQNMNNNNNEQQQQQQQQQQEEEGQQDDNNNDDNNNADNGNNDEEMLGTEDDILEEELDFQNSIHNQEEEHDHHPMVVDVQEPHANGGTAAAAAVGGGDNNPNANANANNNNNIDSDITIEMLNEYYIEIDKIILDDKIEYVEAQAKCPQLFLNGNECNPKYFIRCCLYNIEDAAKRMCKYWKMRKLVFGPTKAFIPITLTGSMSDDINEWSTSIRNILLILPNDTKGRTVVAYDRSLITKLHHLSPNIIVRIVWYIGHYILRNDINGRTQHNGVVLLFIMKLASLNHFYRIYAKHIIQSCKDCIPLNTCAIHFFPSDVTNRFILPTIKFLLNPYIRARMKTHRPELTGSELIRDLQPYGLRRDRLPKSIGGTYVPNINWIHEELIKEREQQQQQEREEQR